MQIWAQSKDARVQIVTKRFGFRWTVDFALGWCLAICKWTPFINEDGKQAGWTTIEVWLPKYNPLAKDSGATHVRTDWRKRADILHIVPRRELEQLREML